jgi:cupin 2 domain-containing protein
LLPAIRNLLEAHPRSGGELLTTVLQESGFRLEHIISNGAASPPGFWYDQDEPEWVALLRGHATLEFEGGRLTLKPGDSLLIPAHARHRVADTSSDAVWLALHLTTISRETRT